MQKTKLIQLLKTLSVEEFRRFKKFIQSPYYNSNPKLLALYNYLSRYHPSFEAPRLTKEHAFHKVFSNESFSAAKFHKLTFHMVQIAEEYLIHLEHQDLRKRRKILTKIYGKRNLYPLFEKETKKLLSELSSNNYRDQEYFADNYQLYFDYYFHPLTQKHTLEDNALTALMEGIDMQFLLAKYRIGSEMKNRERILSRKYQIRFLKAIEKESQTGYPTNNPVFDLYRLLFNLYDAKKQDEIFEMLKPLLLQSFNNIRQIDQSFLLTQMINHAARRINAGEATYYKEALDLYKMALAHQLVLENQQIEAPVFGNIVLLGCHAKEFEWTNSFIKEYQAFLNEDIREDTIMLNTGLLYFHQKDFEQAYQLFSNHAFSLAFQPKSRSNLIRTLYELFQKDPTLFDLLISKIDAFDKHLKRNQLISLDTKEAYLNQLILLKKMATGLNQQKDRQKLAKSLLRNVNNKKMVIGRKWLIEKVHQIGD